MKSVCVLVLVLVLSLVNCENILGYLPFGAKSHFVVFNVLMKELASRGHKVFVISRFKEPGFIKNYESIRIEDGNEVTVSNLTVGEITNPNLIITPSAFFFSEAKKNGDVIKSPIVGNLVKRNISFDLVLYEMFTDDLFLLFAKHKWNVPVIGFSSCYPFPWILEHFGVYENPAYVPNFYTGFNKNMNFFQRAKNLLLYMQGSFFFRNMLIPKTDEIFETMVGKNNHSLGVLYKNISLLLTHNHFTLHRPIPFPPQIVEIGGIHVTPPKPLQKELDQWMRDSPHGVVYFSFGSMLRGATLPTDKVKAFLQVFSSLPQRVLWKWEDDTVDNLPSNVKIMKWLPQRDILGHPKTRVFISHGGLLGTIEAVVSGVPILGIPMYGDQPNNVASLVENGVAVHVDYNNISVASLSYALNTLLNDKSYVENARQLSQRFLDRPMSPLDTAVYWTEYVIRHKGAPHLRSAAIDMPWYQYYLLDVIAVCLAVLVAIVSVILYIISSLCRCIFSKKAIKLKSS